MNCGWERPPNRTATLTLLLTLTLIWWRSDAVVLPAGDPFPVPSVSLSCSHLLPMRCGAAVPFQMEDVWESLPNRYSAL